MGLFSKELLNVVEWNESKEGIIFWKWSNDEIKKGSKLIISSLVLILPCGRRYCLSTPRKCW